MGNRIIDSIVDEKSTLTNCVVISSNIVDSNLTNCVVIGSNIIDCNIKDSYFNESTVEECYIIEKLYCNKGNIKRALDIVRCHIDGGKDNVVEISNGGRPVILTRCFFTNNSKFVGGDAYNSHFDKDSVLENCESNFSQFKEINIIRRIIENNVVGDYELPTSESLKVIEIDDED